jgi:NAD-reducing hydrogenase small subunit
MSFLDMDEGLVDLADKIQMVYGPLMDAKEIPEDIDLFLISGAVSTDEDVEQVKTIRERSELVVSLGDCAVTGNIVNYRNLLDTGEMLQNVYGDTSMEDPDELPRLLSLVRPVHQIIQVDGFIQGCPPDAQLIGFYLGELVEGRVPGRGIRTKFG